MNTSQSSIPPVMMRCLVLPDISDGRMLWYAETGSEFSASSIFELTALTAKFPSVIIALSRVLAKEYSIV